MDTTSPLCPIPRRTANASHSTLLWEDCLESLDSDSGQTRQRQHGLSSKPEDIKSPFHEKDEVCKGHCNSIDPLPSVTYKGDFVDPFTTPSTSELRSSPVSEPNTDVNNGEVNLPTEILPSTTIHDLGKLSSLQSITRNPKTVDKPLILQDETKRDNEACGKRATIPNHEELQLYDALGHRKMIKNNHRERSPASNIDRQSALLGSPQKRLSRAKLAGLFPSGHSDPLLNERDTESAMKVNGDSMNIGLADSKSPEPNSVAYDLQAAKSIPQLMKGLPPLPNESDRRLKSFVKINKRCNERSQTPSTEVRTRPSKYANDDQDNSLAIEPNFLGGSPRASQNGALTPLVGFNNHSRVRHSKMAVDNTTSQAYAASAGVAGPKLKLKISRSQLKRMKASRSGTVRRVYSVNRGFKVEDLDDNDIPESSQENVVVEHWPKKHNVKNIASTLASKPQNGPFKDKKLRRNIRFFHLRPLRSKKSPIYQLKSHSDTESGRSRRSSRIQQWA